MKFTCNQQVLSKSLNIVSRAVTSRTTIPILKGILLDAKDNNILSMSASDLDISVNTQMEVNVVEEGSIVVNAKFFTDIIRKFPKGEISIECDDNKVLLKCNNSEFNIVGMPTDEFPKIGKIESDAECVVFDKRLLKSMIDNTAFAASIDEARGIITGILTEIDEESMNMVTIDGYRMAINRRPAITGEKRKFVISAKTMLEISHIIGEADGGDDKGKLYLTEKKAIFEFDNIKAEIRQMEGEYMDYEKILPKSSKISLIISKKYLQESIDRASILSRSGKDNLIKIKVKDNLMTITSSSEEGNVREDIAIKKEGDDITIGFNSQYINDVLKSVDDDDIKMLFNTPVTPCLVEPVDGDEYKYLILPVRIN